MLQLTNQDHDQTYEYTGQPLYSVPVLSPTGALWGFNLHLDGVEELLGTFDTLDEIVAEIAAIQAAEGEYTVKGFSDYDSTEDSDWLAAYIDGLEDYS